MYRPLYILTIAGVELHRRREEHECTRRHLLDDGSHRRWRSTSDEDGSRAVWIAARELALRSRGRTRHTSCPGPLDLKKEAKERERRPPQMEGTRTSDTTPVVRSAAPHLDRRIPRPDTPWRAVPRPDPRLGPVDNLVDAVQLLAGAARPPRTGAGPWPRQLACLARLRNRGRGRRRRPQPRRDVSLGLWQHWHRAVRLGRDHHHGRGDGADQARDLPARVRRGHPRTSRRCRPARPTCSTRPSSATSARRSTAASTVRATWPR